MDVLPTIFGIVVVAAAAAFALLPFVRMAGQTAAQPAPAASNDRVGLYQQVLELEFDYELGKLSREDYQELSAELLAQAGASLQTERGVISELDTELEREIAAARAAFAAARQESERAGRPRRSRSRVSR